LYRNNFVSATIEQELLFRGMEYKMVGSVRFSERREIKDVMNYILFLIKYDDMSLSKIINVPSRKIGPVAFAKLDTLRSETKMNTI
jgi:DNA helicase-2/ATP-dependent DNA helicase PcrA